MLLLLQLCLRASFFLRSWILLCLSWCFSSLLGCGCAIDVVDIALAILRVTTSIIMSSAMIFAPSSLAASDHDSGDGGHHQRPHVHHQASHHEHILLVFSPRLSRCSFAGSLRGEVHCSELSGRGSRTPVIVATKYYDPGLGGTISGKAR